MPMSPDNVIVVFAIVARLSKPLACVVGRVPEREVGCAVNGAFDVGGSSLESWPTMVIPLAGPLSHGFPSR
ncbi:hypothetical protein Rcae01_01221 [Novipirellula caenicola]|uniref:Secreted protein n=1 Tax=Novipirellula caenicola TaxID=1536901 RepID=A0ABP9VKQ2_9BACT